jgi:peptide/nickel transport system substrate-binding protein
MARHRGAKNTFYTKKGDETMRSDYWTKVSDRRVSRRRSLALAGGAAAGAALLAACGGSDGDSGGDSQSLVSKPIDSTSQAKRGGISKWYFPSEANHFDIHTGQAPLNVPKNFAYSNLTQNKPGHLEPSQYDLAGDMAESWEWSGDRLQLTMKVRPGVKWHNKPPVNGRAFDIDDILYSWERYSRTATDRGTLSNAANPNAPVLSMTAADRQTLVVKLAEPLVYLLSALAASASGRFGLVPKETDNGFDIRRDMIGTGPFVLENYTASVGFTWKRHPEYWDKTFPLVDQVETPILTEYAAALAQLKAGNIYHYLVRPDDLLAVKNDVPQLQIYPVPSTTVTSGDILRFGTLPTPANRPFRDERVRQAVAMSYDRDLFIDTFENVSKFEQAGLPVDTYWYTAIGNAPGWWLDPKGKEFGPNAKYLHYDPSEAKKLLSAAGYANGVDVTSTIVAGPERGADYQKILAVREEFAAQVGFKITTNPVDYTTVYIPRIRDGKGEFEGWAYAGGAASADDAVAYMVQRYYSKGPATFLGFDVKGSGDHSGDPHVDSEIDKAKGEADTEKRRAIVYELQRYLAKAAYGVSDPGSASGFEMAWPVLGNFAVYHGDRRGPNFNWWIDDTQPPLRKS